MNGPNDHPRDRIRFRKPTILLGLGIFANFITSGIQGAEVQTMKQELFAFKKHMNPPVHAVINSGSKISSEFRKLSSLVSAVHGYHACQRDFKPNTDHKVQAFQQNSLQLRDFYIRDQLRNSCHRMDNVLQRAWNDIGNIIATGKMYSSDWTDSLL